MSEPRQHWKNALRAAFGALLLVWIFHSIFVNEARVQARRPEGLFTPDGQRVNWDDSLPRLQQWRCGWRYGPPALASKLRSAEPASCVIAFALMGGMLFLGVLRWQIVLRVHGLELPLGQATQLSLIAHFFNAFLLGTAGGDVVKAYYAAQETHHKKTEAVVTVFVDRIIGLWAMLLFGGVMILPNYQLFGRPGLLRTAAAVLVAMLAAASAFMFLALRGGVSRAWPGARHWLRRLPKGERVEQVLDSCRIFGQSPRFLPRTLGLSILINLLMVWQFIVLARGLHLAPPPGALYLVVPVVICISALPISPSGLGVRENLFVHLLAVPAIGVPETGALSLSLLAYAMSLAWSVIGGLLYVTRKDRRRLREVAQGEES